MATIYLEFRHQAGNLAANGSDIVTWIDGRWSESRKAEEIYAKVEELRKFRGGYNKQKFVGYSFPRSTSIHGMEDRNPPEWA